MIRFLVNFFLFGLLFYLISRFFPEAFETLVHWVAQVFDFLRDMVLWLIDRIKTASNN